MAGLWAGTYRPNLSCVGSVEKPFNVAGSFFCTRSADSKGLNRRSINSRFLASGVVSVKATALNTLTCAGLAPIAQSAANSPNARGFMPSELVPFLSAIQHHSDAVQRYRF